MDHKGRIVIPAHVRRELGIKKAVKARVEEGRVIIEPLEDPVEALTRLVEEGTVNVEREIRQLRSEAQHRLLGGGRA